MKPDYAAWNSRVQGTDTALAQGLSGLLAYARAHHSEAVPLADLTAAELDAKITALAGTCGLSLLLRQALEEERTRRQGAQGKAPQHEPTLAHRLTWLEQQAHARAMFCILNSGPWSQRHVCDE